MLPTITTLSPRQTFDDNMRPAVLLLRIYRLLDSNDKIVREGDLVDALREIIHSSAEEDLMLIYNEVFLGLVRERAQLPLSALRQTTLCHLLRQAVVAGCTALDAYLPSLLQQNLPTVISVRGRDFVPRDDKLVQGCFSKLTFSLDETLRLIDDEHATKYIANKILGLFSFQYLSNRTGIHVVGVLLGLPDPWAAIAAHLDEKAEELARALRDTVRRRNDIVHRADRPQKNPRGEMQTITFSWTRRAVDAINHICLALDELVEEQMKALQAVLAT